MHAGWFVATQRITNSTGDSTDRQVTVLDRAALQKASAILNCVMHLPCLVNK